MKNRSGIYFVLCVTSALSFWGCASTYESSITMSNLSSGVQQGRSIDEHFFIAPDFHFVQEKKIIIAPPQMKLPDGSLSRGEAQYYSQHIQEKLESMLSEIGFKVTAESHSEDADLILETFVVKLLIGSDVSRQTSGLLGPFVFAPVVHVEGAFYELPNEKRRKVFAFYEEGGKPGGSFINNLSGQELVLASFDDMINKNLKEIIKKHLKYTKPEYSRYRITEVGLAKNIEVHSVLVGTNIEGKGDVFQFSDGQLEWYAEFENKGFMQALEKRQFRAVWYAPDGSVHQDQKFSTAAGNALIARNILKLDLTRKDLIGKWRVKVYEDEQPMDERFFTVLGDDAEDLRSKAMENALLAKK